MVCQDQAEFNSVVQTPDKPVLMMFFKGGCASCAALEPTMDTLAGEYEGRAVVAKIMIVQMDFMPAQPEIMKQYYMHIVPAAILFNHGQEVKRWYVNYNINDYRKGLDEAIQSPNSAAR